MKFRILFIVVFLLTYLSGVKAQQANDLSLYKSISNENIKKVFSLNNNEAIVFAGDSTEKVYKVINNKTFIPIILDSNSLNKIQFTDCLILDTGKILLGTKQNFLYYINNKTIAHLDQLDGLNDSSVIKINKNKKNNDIEVVTPQKNYKIVNINNLRKIHLEETDNKKSIIKSLGKTIKYKIRQPIQEYICTVASGLDYSFRPKKYIGEKQLDTLKKIVHPGDFLIKRDNYVLSNVGIPGFWTHSGIYIGGKDELDSFFKDIPMLGGEKPSDYLLKNYPRIFDLINNKQNLIIEAIGEGVVINPIEHIAKVDFLAVLRTSLAKEDIFKSLLTAFEYLGYPYDFLFDLTTDKELVCSELIYNSFKPSFDKKGIKFPISRVMGGPFVSPDDIAKKYCEELNSVNKSLDLIIFFDADSKKKISFPSNNKGFCMHCKEKSK